MTTNRRSLNGLRKNMRRIRAGETPEMLRLTGFEAYTLGGIADAWLSGKPLTIRDRRDDGAERILTVITRIETLDEVAYCRHGDILPYVRQLLNS